MCAGTSAFTVMAGPCAGHPPQRRCRVRGAPSPSGHRLVPGCCTGWCPRRRPPRRGNILVTLGRSPAMSATNTRSSFHELRNNPTRHPAGRRGWDMTADGRDRRSARGTVKNCATTLRSVNTASASRVPAPPPPPMGGNRHAPGAIADKLRNDPTRHPDGQAGTRAPPPKRGLRAPGGTPKNRATTLPNPGATTGQTAQTYLPQGAVQPGARP